LELGMRESAETSMGAGMLYLVELWRGAGQSHPKPAKAMDIPMR
jgi:hypothetical protein